MGPAKQSRTTVFGLPMVLSGRGNGAVHRHYPRCLVKRGQYSARFTSVGMWLGVPSLRMGLVCLGKAGYRHAVVKGPITPG